MLDFADRCLLPVRMLLEQKLVHRVADNLALIVQRPVFFLVNNLQFRLKETEDGVQKPLGLDHRPLFQPVGRKADLVNRFLVPGVRIQTHLAHRWDANCVSLLISS